MKRCHFNISILRLFNLIAVIFILICLHSSASSEALLTTPGDGNLAIIFPDPDAGLPNPVQINLSGLPANAVPNAASFFGCHRALVTDRDNPRIFVVDTSSATVISTINTTSFYYGKGTIAVSPDGLFALALGNSNNLAVIAAPSGPSSNITSVQLPGMLAAYQAHAIVFDADKTAYVYHRTGISILHQPYTSIDFTIPVDNTSCGSIVINPTGDKILVTNQEDQTLRIFTAPFAADSTPETLVLSTSGFVLLSGIEITPDGNTALVASDWDSPKLFAVSSPFGTASSHEEIPLPNLGGSLGFEDIGISADGQLAIITGGSYEGLKAAFVKAPFTAADATAYAVNIAGPGRGEGVARFLPPQFAMVLSPFTIPDGSYGKNYSQPISVSGGIAPYAFEITSGQLPNGITLNTATGLISGRPSETGSFSFTITVTDATGCNDHRKYTLSITSCTGSFFDDFEDGIFSWYAFKPTWSESNGNLIGVSNTRKALAIAPPRCICLKCNVKAVVSTAGGTGSKIWLFTHYKDKDNTLELVIKSDAQKIILSEKSGGTRAQKVKATYTFDPNVLYTLDVSFDGINIAVSVNGTAVITTPPVGQLEFGTIGFQSKLTTIEITDVSVQ